MKVLQARLVFTLGTTKTFLCLKVYPAALCNGAGVQNVVYDSLKRALPKLR